MADTSLGLLSGQQITSTSGTAGAVPLYNSDGSLTQLTPSKPSTGMGGVAMYLPLTLGRTDTGLTLTAPASNYAVVITATALTPGARLLIEVVTALTETPSANISATVNSVRVS